MTRDCVTSLVLITVMYVNYLHVAAVMEEECLRVAPFQSFLAPLTSTFWMNRLLKGYSTEASYVFVLYIY